MDALTSLDPMIVALAAVILSSLACILMIVINMRQRKLLARYRTLLSGNSEMNLEQVLLEQQQDHESLQRKMTSLLQEVENLKQSCEVHIQKSAILRYNAFPDTGSDLSFTIALLDAHNTGFVISSLYGRSESRIYAKPVKNGVTTYALSDEEKSVLATAMGSEGGKGK